MALAACPWRPGFRRGQLARVNLPVRRRFCFHDYQLIADGWMVDDFVPRSGQHLSQPATFSRTALTAMYSGRGPSAANDRYKSIGNPFFLQSEANNPDIDAVTCAEYYRPAFAHRRLAMTAKKMSLRDAKRRSNLAPRSARSRRRARIKSSARRQTANGRDGDGRDQIRRAFQHPGQRYREEHPVLHRGARLPAPA